MLTARRSTSQECLPLKNSMCLTIDKPFYTAFICGQCLNNVHGEATYADCFKIGGSNMPADRPYVKVLTTLNGVMLNADRRGHQGFSNAY